jgi:cell division inhibitor SulA/protein ImuA
MPATVLDSLPQHPALWRGDRLALPALPGIPTGFAELDAVLPGGGWPVDGLTEIFSQRRGIGELSMVMPALARLSREDERWLVWITPPDSPCLPYAPALAKAGISLPRLILVRPRSAKEGLWAMQQALTSHAASAVLAWLTKPALTDLRRLQLAAAGATSLALIFRPPVMGGESSPSPLRLRLEPRAPRQLAVHVLKRRGGPLGRPLHLDLAGADHALDRHPPARNRPADFPARLGIA